MTISKTIPIIIIGLFGHLCLAQNPILREDDPHFLYACDPSAEVFNGKVYLYCSHDQPDALNYEGMKDYVILESADLKTWINHGVVLDPQLDKGFEYAHSNMNAPDAAYKDGWYYWYFPSDITHVGVAKSRSPIGPWESAVDNEIATIFDPTVFVDDDGQAYIYGNDHWVDIGDEGSHILGAKLKDNMIELDGPWVRLTKEKVNEAVHVFKRDSIYYFSARVGPVTQYWMADSPLPQYADLKGVLTPNSPRSPNHTSAIEFEGQWYLFYHRGDVNHGSNYRRSVCFDKMTFREDGTIEPVVYTLDEDVEITEALNLPRTRAKKPALVTKAKPLENGDYRCEAEDFFEASGAELKNGRVQLMAGEAWVGYENIEFGKSAQPFAFRVKVAASQGGTIVLRVNSPKGTVIGSIPVPATGGAEDFQVLSTTLNRIRSAQNIYLCFSGGSQEVIQLDWFEWTPAK